ncbi:kinesin-like protein KIF6 [Hippopotamus amphibius kiboko]|uniref:kinesin-like protein KIF6 n=1 Tax=Hippopotamus amphibius kiboko TaxID=575201 RepID=UPI002592B7F1|nr:kinesin-like protein KIF6 [Hippopotamus amphibius kiboko]
MVKQTIQIFARVKPTVRKQRQGIYSISEDEKLTPSLEIILPRDLADGFVNNKRESYRFKFQRVFDQDAKQETIFENIAKPVAESVLAGYNGTIFAYGQTGSGKTFTITGGAERYSDRGIIPRTLSYIFEQLQKDSSKIYTTHISYLEIYNECGYDLLDPRHEASSLEDLPKVTVLEDPDQNIHLKNLSLHQATTEEEALNLLFLGDTNRMIAETPMNQASTRSHCIFTIHLSSKEPGSATVCHAKLHLVDLAGSERVAKTGVGGQLLTEAKYINLSLHYLEQVIIALSEKHRSHIPYRNSMMTSVLRDSLGGNCMTTMIATLSLEKRNIDESISTCRFAQRVALIKNEAVLNEEIDPRLMIIRLQKEIQELKDELAIVTGEQRTEALTEAEILQLEKLITSFLEDQDPESKLEVGADMRKIHHCFHYLKKLLNDQKVHRTSIASSEIKDQNCQEPLKEEEYKKLRDILQQRDNEINILVNMLKKEKKKAQDALHFSSMDRSELRHSQSSPFPPGNPEGLRTLPPSAPTQALDSSTSQYRSSLLQRKTGMREEMSLGRQEAFEIFKRDHTDSVTIEDNKQILKQRFSEAKALGESINEARSKIGRLKEEITQRHMQQVALGISENTPVPSMPDLLEEKLRSQLEEEKRRYKTMFTRLKALKVEIEHLQLLMDKAKVKLQKEFEAWWAAEATSLQVNTPAVNSLNHVKPFPQTPESQHERSQLLSNKSDVYARKILPSPGPVLHSQEQRSPSTPLEDRTPERPVSSVPLTGDSQTDSDILAFIKARQSILQRTGQCTFPGGSSRAAVMGRRGGRLEQQGAEDETGSFRGLPKPQARPCSHFTCACLSLLLEKAPEGSIGHTETGHAGGRPGCPAPLGKLLSLLQVFSSSCCLSPEPAPLCPALAKQEGLSAGLVTCLTAGSKSHSPIGAWSLPLSCRCQHRLKAQA